MYFCSLFVCSPSPIYIILIKVKNFCFSLLRQFLKQPWHVIRAKNNSPFTQKMFTAYPVCPLEIDNLSWDGKKGLIEGQIQLVVDNWSTVLKSILRDLRIQSALGKWWTMSGVNPQNSHLSRGLWLYIKENWAPKRDGVLGDQTA